ncbi:LOW QUALITY PROTEIN: transglycosylase [Podospora pseudopauciseta]|uniref:Transglycosylase n=1 Tax=Podospora pseudopauciseta TaxID=2093780 RepID=A0ABR0HMB3_9PEZI|nr:LOW QUALITY PROTEIN: transglycosylase [Podospora pseudopauciseta]
MRFSLSLVASFSAARCRGLVCPGHRPNLHKLALSPDVGLPVPKYSIDFRNGRTTTIGHLSARGPSRTRLSAVPSLSTSKTAWYFFFGRAEVAHEGSQWHGHRQLWVLESDDLDEIDWEWIGGERKEVQTNYFGKGNTTTWDRGGKTAMGDTQGLIHNYTIDWTPSLVTWYIDGAIVRTLAYQDALGGRNFPQTPMRLKLGIWAGGDSNNPNGTIDWAGGVTNYTQGPFTMYVESVSVTNLNPAASYFYSDLSGSWKSISMTNVTTGPVPSQAPEPMPERVAVARVVKGTDKRDKGGITSDEEPFVTHDVTETASGVASSATGFAGHGGNPITTTTMVSTDRPTEPANIISGGSSLTTRFGLMGILSVAVCTVGMLAAV